MLVPPLNHAPTFRTSQGAITVLVLLALAGTLPLRSHGGDARPPGIPPHFVELAQVIPDLVIDLRYCGENNFVGTPIDGYTEHRCWLTSAAATALAKVQKDLSDFGLGLKVFDAYRPQSAVDHFVRWVQSPNSADRKEEHFPSVEKSRLIADGYISDRSGHSRGSTVDLTIVSYPDGPDNSPIELDMGTPFDFFGKESQTAFPNLTASQRQNRLLLKSLMERHGFVNYSKEWWHYRFKSEPYPDTYFDFPTGGVPSLDASGTEKGSAESPKTKDPK